MYYVPFPSGLPDVVHIRWGTWMAHILPDKSGHRHQVCTLKWSEIDTASEAKVLAQLMFKISKTSKSSWDLELGSSGGHRFSTIRIWMEQSHGSGTKVLGRGTTISGWTATTRHYSFIDFWGLKYKKRVGIERSLKPFSGHWLLRSNKSRSRWRGLADEWIM